MRMPGRRIFIPLPGTVPSHDGGTGGGLQARQRKEMCDWNSFLWRLLWPELEHILLSPYVPKPHTCWCIDYVERRVVQGVCGRQILTDAYVYIMYYIYIYIIYIHMLG